ncbi:amidohydrolase family protein [Actinomadura rupiterrae]|uniref:amidohydrolase family protein n=1 Tax=Actinomadura rupiterrae TaxID=559627 RepID=UPI0020A4EEC5|nr:amidohydrolase family protein [Actinomadura rupiterrae]MCP2339417.1 imidazolonepropionase-like amidohydrolase [Actinomadura rupiterrae]
MPHDERARSRREVLGGTAALAGAALFASASATAAAAATPAGPAARRGKDEAFALTHVTLIDATGAPPQNDMTVLVRGRTIAAIGKTGALAVPADAKVLDLTGRFVIPGLVESHVHSAGPEAVVPPLYALTGVTTVREMRGESVHHRWRDRIASGALLGPRWIIGSPIIDGRPSLHTSDTGSLIEVADAAGARAAVRRVKREGADFVKVYSRLTRAAYFAIADEARRQGIPYTGHCPDPVTIAEAVRAGHRTLEHMDAVLLATSSREAEIRRGMAAITTDASQDTFHRYHAWYQQVYPLEHIAVRSFDPQRTDALFDDLRRHARAVVPTLRVHQTLETPETNRKTDEWRYLPSGMTGWWADVTEVMTGGRSPEQAARIREIFEHRKALVGRMHRAGVQVLAGTDTGNPYLVPGFALHEELELLVQSGLTPMQALQAATNRPAQAFGMDAEVGTVEPGKRADLVVLDADPLADIRNTRRIDALVVNGRLITSDERARLLADVEQAARSDQSQTTAMAAGCACAKHPSHA